MKKVTMQDIADHLGISRVSVWKALNGHSGVSSSLQTRVRDAAVQLGYFEQLPAPEPSRGALPAAGQSASGRSRTIAVIVSRPNSSLFWMRILDRIAVLFAERNVNMMYMYVPAAPPADYVLPASLSDGSVDGLIIINVYSEQITRLLAGLPVPKVYLDKETSLDFHALHGDLLLIEGRACTREITDRVIRRGGTRLAFIGDIAYAETNKDRWDGFCDAVHMHGLTADPACLMTGPIPIESYEQEIADFLAGLPVLPDAVICVSDFVAHFAAKYYDSVGTDWRRELILTGFDDSDEYENVSGKITTVAVDNESIAERLASQILMLCDKKSGSRKDRCVSYLWNRILYRGALAGR